MQGTGYASAPPKGKPEDYDKNKSKKNVVDEPVKSNLDLNGSTGGKL